VRVYDYRCPVCNNREERFVKNTDAVQYCRAHPVCRMENTIMTRLTSAPRVQLEPFTGAFPGAADKWVKTRDKRMAEERKHKDRHGTEWIGKNA
jgi:hypothetical protein